MYAHERTLVRLSCAEIVNQSLALPPIKGIDRNLYHGVSIHSVFPYSVQIPRLSRHWFQTRLHNMKDHHGTKSTNNRSWPVPAFSCDVLKMLMRPCPYHHLSHLRSPRHDDVIQRQQWRKLLQIGKTRLVLGEHWVKRDVERMTC